MNSVKSRDINLLVVHGDKGVTKRQQTIVTILKGRTEDNGGRFTVRYEPFDSMKINGESWSEVIYDEISSVGNN